MDAPAREFKVHILQSLLGLLIISTLTFTCLRWLFLQSSTNVTTRQLPLKHANTNVITLLLTFCESSLSIQSCQTTCFFLRLQVLHLRTYHVPSLLSLNLISTYNLFKHPQSHNLLSHHTWLQFDHNTFHLQACVLTRNDLAYQAQTESPPLSTLDPYSLLSTVLDPWDLLLLPSIAPAVALTPKRKMQL